MIGDFLSALFTLILTLLATIMQILLLPINALFEGLFPDLTESINNVLAGFGTILGNLAWAVSLIPPMLGTALLLILAIEIALIVVLKSTRLTTKLWNLIQRIKVW